MAGGRLNFWGVVTASCAGFLLLVLIIVFATLLVLSSFRTSAQVPEAQVRENVALVGQILLREEGKTAGQ